MPFQGKSGLHSSPLRFGYKIERVREARRTFVRGAAILAFGSLSSRVLGAVYRFLLPWIMGGGRAAQEGVGLFSMAYPIYLSILGIATSGFPIAISKLVSEKLALGKREEAARIFRRALYLLGGMGALATLFLFLSAPLYARYVARDLRATVSLQAIAPAIFLVSLLGGYRGLFIGLQEMTPCAVSLVVEQAVRISSLLLLAALLLPRGIEWSAAGANFGAVIGAVVALLFLLHLARGKLPPEPVSRSDFWPEARRLFAYSFPISLAGAIYSLLGFLDALLVPSRLHAAGLGSESTRLYGILAGYAMPFLTLAGAVMYPLATSLIPALAEKLALGDRPTAAGRWRVALRLTFLFGFPAWLGLAALSREIPQLLFRSPEAGEPLFFLAPAMLFVSLEIISAGALQALGKPLLLFRNVALAGVVKVFLNWTLTALPAVNVSGAALATSAASLTAASLNLRELSGNLGPFPWKAALKPLLCALAMALLVRGALTLLSPLWGPDLATIGSIGLGASFYGLLLLVSGEVKKEEIARLLPVKLR